METVGYALAVAMTLPTLPIPPLPTPERVYTEPPSFNLLTCSANATDVVVTDAEGKVLECWRGELKPGEIVRLGPGRLTPANALPLTYLRLRPDRALSPLYRELDLATLPREWYERAKTESDFPLGLWSDAGEAEKELRLVLFLRKEGGDGVGRVWMPATVPPTPLVHEVFEPRFSGPPRLAIRHPVDMKADFSTSIALVEGGHVLALRPAERCLDVSWEDFNCFVALSTPVAFTRTELAPVARTLGEFKDDVMRLPRPLPAKFTNPPPVQPKFTNPGVTVSGFFF